MNTKDPLPPPPELPSKLPSDATVREIVLSTFHVYEGAFRQGLAVVASDDLEMEGRPLVQDVIEAGRALVHGKVDGVLDLLADRQRLHEMVDAALDAVIESVGAEEVPPLPHLCANCAVEIPPPPSPQRCSKCAAAEDPTA